MNKIRKTLTLFLTAIIAMSCLCIAIIKPAAAQSTPVPEIAILYPANGTFFNVSVGVEYFQLKYATNDALSWIGYSVDSSQNRTAYGAWYNIDQISHDAEGNPNVRVSGVFESDGNHNLTLYANNTSGDWALPQTVTYRVNFNADTYTPPATSNPAIPFASLSPTSTPFPTPIITENVPNYPLLMQITLIMAAIFIVLVSVILYRKASKSPLT
jgi:hypothetical protein